MTLRCPHGGSFRLSKGCGLLRLSEFYIPTLREAPGEAQIPSDKLLRRGGFIRPLAAGVFSYLPLGYIVLDRVEQIVREEMNAAGALELFMPVMQPRELWERSGRWDTFEPQPIRFKDRGGREFCMGPTHEEVITSLVAEDVTSYKQLPMTLYQIQTKFRDELRARGGLIRVKEFLMKDAYSFDIDRAGLDQSYEKMYDAYVRIFERCGLSTEIVRADAGSMGGFDTREFMATSENGEDTIYKCDSCDYASNAECAACRAPEPTEQPTGIAAAPEIVSTPGTRSIEAVTQLLGMNAERLVKTLLYSTADGFVAALVRGDRDLNEAKLAALLQAPDLQMATDAQVEELTGAEVGYAGPVGLDGRVRIVADHEIAAMHDFVVGANRTDAHLMGVNVGKDFQPDDYFDLRNAEDGDACPQCAQGKLYGLRAIEIGHIFKLGTRYTEALDGLVQDEAGQQRPMVMGCYGIGVSRMIAAIVEQSHDERGIIWPRSVAPFEVVVLLLDPHEDELCRIADRLHDQLQEMGIRVLLDDRSERAGVKFHDAELVGYPLRAVIGKRTKETGQIELQRRRDGVDDTVSVDTAADTVVEMLQDL
jgi:prolyl-tRNA synthetase